MTYYHSLSAYMKTGFTFIFGAVWIVEGALSMFQVLEIFSHVNCPVLEAIRPLVDENSHTWLQSLKSGVSNLELSMEIPKTFPYGEQANNSQSSGSKESVHQ